MLFYDMYELFIITHIFSYLLCFAAKVQLCFESAMLTGKKVIYLCNKSTLSRYILYIKYKNI